MVNRRAECNGQQAESRRRGRFARRLRRAAPVLAMFLALSMPLAVAGCGADNPALSGGPVDWWHGLEGGAIAQQRPPPPGADQPYPSLGTIPPRPTIPDQAARQQIAQGLVVARAEAEQRAMANPIAPPGNTPPPAPAPATPPPNPSTASATLAAADAPPAPPQKPAPSSPPPPAAAPQPVPAPAKGGAPAAQGPAPAAQASAADLPPIPSAPPPPPRIPGVAIPAVPTQPAALPPPVVPPPSKPGESVWVPFEAGSAVLSHDGAQSLRALAGRRHGAPIAIIGHGDAISDAPDAQAAALSLALQRAHAMANSLIADGIPAASVTIQADAGGRGGDARLVD